MENELIKAKENYSKYGVANLTLESWNDSWSGKNIPLKQMVEDFEKTSGYSKTPKSIKGQIDINKLQRLNPMIQIKVRQ